MAVEHLTKLNDDGTTFGQSTADLISVYATTVTAQQTGVTRITTAGGVNTTAMRESYNALIGIIERFGIMSTLGAQSSSV